MEFRNRMSRWAVLPGMARDGTPPPPTPEPPPPPPEPRPLPKPDRRPAAIAALLEGLPLAGYADEMVAAAELGSIDWRLLPVIGLLESTGGLHACGGNAWGYASCGIVFADFHEGIARVAEALASPPYRGLEVESVLCIWVSGHGCAGAQALGYLAKGQVLLARLEELAR